MEGAKKLMSEMKKKEEVGRSVKTIKEEFGEAPMTLEDRRTVALERIADSAKKEEEEEVLEELVKTIQEEFGEAPTASGLLTLRHETLGGRPRDRSLFLFCRNRLLALGLPWILEKGGKGSKVYSSMFCIFFNL